MADYNYSGDGQVNWITGEDLPGTNILSGYGAGDVILGGDGDDTIFGNYIPGISAPPTGPVVSADGNDFLDGQDGNDRIYGQEGNDVLLGGCGSDTLSGGIGNDLLNGQSGNDLLYGDDGDDTLIGGTGVDVGYGGTGNDLGHGGTGTDTLYGGDGNDSLWGDQGADKLDGDLGDDLLQGGKGADRLYGHAGNDTLWGFQDPNDPANFNGQTSDNANDSLWGGSGNDYAYGNGGDDFIDGGAGNDNLSGGTGKDIILGGQGNDKIYGNSDDDYLVGGTGSDKVAGGAGNDTLIGFDPAVNSSVKDLPLIDTLCGGTGADYFVVNGGTAVNPAYSFNGDDDYVIIKDFSGVGYLTNDPGDGDKIQLLAALKDHYVFYEGEDPDTGDTFKDIYVNDGYSGKSGAEDFLARVYEKDLDGGVNFNLAQDVVYV